MRKFFAVAVLMALFAAAAIAKAPEAGQPAINFTLKNMDGKDVSLADYKGKWVVLYFYPKSGTPGCTTQARNFNADLDQYTKRNAVILGVSGDEVKDQKEFCNKENLKFTILADPGLKVAEQYDAKTNLLVGAFASRDTYLIGPDGNVARVFKKVKPSENSKEVLAAIDELAKK